MCIWPNTQWENNMGVVTLGLVRRRVRELKGEYGLGQTWPPGSEVVGRSLSLGKQN